MIEAALELKGIIRTLFPLPITVIVEGALNDISPGFTLISSCTLHPDSYKSDNNAKSRIPLCVAESGCFSNSVIAVTLK